MLQFDHVIIGVNDLDVAINDYRQAGFNVIYGGEHATGTTQNALIPFEDSTYLELMAKTGKVPKPDGQGVDFATYLHEEEGYIGYSIYTNALDTLVGRLKTAGLAISEPFTGKRIRQDGVILCWRMVTIPLGKCVILLIQDETNRADRIPVDQSRHTNGAKGIKAVLHAAEDIAPIAAYLQAMTEQRPDNHVYTIGQCRLTLSPLNTDAIKAYHEKRGDSVWRVVLDGIGARYKRFAAATLHSVELIIAGNV